MKDEWREHGVAGDITEEHHYFQLQYKSNGMWRHWASVSDDGFFDKFWETFQRSYPNVPKRALKQTYEVTKYEAT